jgi:nicotinate-nucleotide pyrophosphorylase
MSERSYVEAAREAAARALAEDLAGYGDITGSAFAGDGAARVVAREAGVLSGLAAFTATAALVDPALRVEYALADGDRFAAGAVLAGLRGPLAGILDGAHGAQLPLPPLRCGDAHGRVRGRDDRDAGAHRGDAQDDAGTAGS